MPPIAKKLLSSFEDGACKTGRRSVCCFRMGGLLYYAVFHVTYTIKNDIKNVKWPVVMRYHNNAAALLVGHERC